MAPENFFYSHSYSFLYGEPTTLSGGSAIYKFNDQWSANLGLDTGWNDWVDVSHKLNYMGGFNWTSKDQKQTLAWEMFIGDQLPNVDSNRTHYCLVFTQKLGKKWQYVLENNVGYEENANVLPNGNRTHGDWVGLSNYLIYTINDKWSLGFRYEWFDDDDGTVVAAVGPPPVSAVPSHYNALTWGLNYKPNKNVVLRSEMRYDHSTAPVFENGTIPTRDQYLWAFDAIVRF
jgi:opacity protein-like surface antigen